jgi:hypothetical protein
MTNSMQGKRQITRSSVANVNRATVWAILTDSRLLPKWAPVVREVEACDASGESVGAVRRCRVELAGRAGRMIERCVELEPERRLAYVVDDESFGMRRMFAHYGFRISLDAVAPAQTSIKIETFYTPRNLVFTALNVLMMRSRFGAVVDRLLSGLVGLAESSR